MAGKHPPQPPTEPLPDPGVRHPDPAERRRPRLFRGGQLVDVAAGQVRSAQEVLVVDGRVQQVGPNLQAPDAETIDVDGRYLLPGLIDLHVHPGMRKVPERDADEQTTQLIKRDLQLWLRYGVTTVQSLGTDQPCASDIRREQANGDFTGARLFSVGSGFGVVGVPPFKMAPPGPVLVDDWDVAHDKGKKQVTEKVTKLANQRASGVKLWYDDWYGEHRKMKPEVARAIIQTARNFGLTTYAHVYYVDDVAPLIHDGLQVLAHMPRDRAADPELIDLIGQRDVAVLPTLTVPESNIAYPDKPSWVDTPLFAQFLPAGTVEDLHDDDYLDTLRTKLEYRPRDLAYAMRNTAAMYLCPPGVLLGFGTDAGVSNRVIGFSEHRELELLVTRCHVSEADALRMATLNSAQILGKADELGQIAPGRFADLVVVGGNPLEDICHARLIESVWLGGAQVAGPLSS
jgi:imidazolonepropionase-like amidohydrolase